jgi:hypothetical protein
MASRRLSRMAIILLATFANCQSTNGQSPLPQTPIVRAATPSVRQSVESQPSYVGRWYTGAPSVCNDAPGTTEGLLTFNSNNVLGYESSCRIVRAIHRGNTTELTERCQGEGETYTIRETVEVIGGRLRRTMIDNGERYVFNYGRCTDKISAVAAQGALRSPAGSPDQQMPLAQKLPQQITSEPSKQPVVQKPATPSSQADPPVARTSCVSGIGPPDDPGTKFRGIYINMRCTDLQRLKMEDFNIRVETSKAEILAKTGSYGCAIVSFDKEGSVEEIEFYRCFFGATDLNLEQFVQSITFNYRIPNLSCDTQMNGDYSVTTCAGPASTGEWISIRSTTSLKSGLSGGPSMRVQRRGPAQRPKFD